MPIVQQDEICLHWRLEGSASNPPLVLLNSIGTDMNLWHFTLSGLLEHFHVLRIDTRGHGASDAPDRDYTLEMLANDVAIVMEAAGIARAAIAGVSLGGMVAMQLALDHPDRVSSLALICTSARMDRASWKARISKVRAEGTAAIADMAVERFLSRAFAATHPEIVAELHRGIVEQSDGGYAGAGAAIRDMELEGRLATIAIPTIVITGSEDISTPWDGHASEIVKRISGSTHLSLQCGHLPPLEVPEALVAALRDTLLPVAEIDRARHILFDAGLENRRRVLGDAWVDKSLKARTPFNADFQAMITRIAWHEIWGRPGLDDRTRRLIVLAITASLGRWEEFVLHVRAGLSGDDISRDELKEVLMQTAIYAGVPAANTAFAEAGKIIAEIDGLADRP